MAKKTLIKNVRTTALTRAVHEAINLFRFKKNGGRRLGTISCNESARILSFCLPYYKQAIFVPIFTPKADIIKIIRNGLAENDRLEEEALKAKYNQKQLF